MHTEQEKLHTTSSAAWFIRKSADTVRAWADCGKLPSVRTVSGTRLFRESDLRTFASKLRVALRHDEK